MNGLGHLGGTVAMGLEGGTGVVTGTLFFISSFCWMVYVVLNSGVMSGKALAVSIAGGIIGHALIPVVFGLHKAGVIGTWGVYVGDIVIVTIPIVVAWIGSRFVGPVAPRVREAATA